MSDATFVDAALTDASFMIVARHIYVLFYVLFYVLYTLYMFYVLYTPLYTLYAL